MTTHSSTNASRREWLGVLAHAPRELLTKLAGSIRDDGFETLRAPEIGLTMLRARVGNRGDRFNLGEATVTRCVVRHRDARGQVSAGVGYVLGRDEERAQWVARIDALLQQPTHQEAMLRDVIAPLAQAIAARRAEERAATAASRVRFYTLAPETA
ncbi:MAG TPA: phosphonate C-P lyase system protein PhnG [Albitalea sp.]|nr:phosphonate C-P lyase system protein PhnG [Albitalea sp.]